MVSRVRRILRVERIHGIAGGGQLGPIWVGCGTVRLGPWVGMTEANELV